MQPMPQPWHRIITTESERPMKKIMLIVLCAAAAMLLWRVWDNKRRTTNFDSIPGWDPNIKKQ